MLDLFCLVSEELARETKLCSLACFCWLPCPTRTPPKDVMLRLMPSSRGDIQVLAKLFGGQGTIHVPSRSPDSRSLAFVSYRLVQP